MTAMVGTPQRWLRILFCAAAWTATGCSPRVSPPGGDVELVVHTEALDGDSMAVEVALLDAAWRPINGASVTVRSASGAGAPAAGIGAGRYRATLIRSAAPSDTLTVEVRRAGRPPLLRQFSLSDSQRR